jgi:hypothetical protein
VEAHVQRSCHTHTHTHTINSSQWAEGPWQKKDLLLFFFNSYVHTRLESFLPSAPTPSLTTRKTFLIAHVVLFIATCNGHENVSPGSPTVRLMDQKLHPEPTILPA